MKMSRVELNQQENIDEMDENVDKTHQTTSSLIVRNQTASRSSQDEESLTNVFRASVRLYRSASILHLIDFTRALRFAARPSSIITLVRQRSINESSSSTVGLAELEKPPQSPKSKWAKLKSVLLCRPPQGSSTSSTISEIDHPEAGIYGIQEEMIETGIQNQQDGRKVIRRGKLMSVQGTKPMRVTYEFPEWIREDRSRCCAMGWFRNACCCMKNAEVEDEDSEFEEEETGNEEDTELEAEETGNEEDESHDQEI